LILNVTSISQLSGIATEIIYSGAHSHIFLFYGEMGAGKTTLIKSICESLGVIGPVTSPTFSIVNEYIGASHKIYHFDFYRLKNQTEALDLGYEEYFYSDAWCFIEWPEKIPGLLPPHYIKINIQVSSDGAREISIEKI